MATMYLSEANITVEWKRVSVISEGFLVERLGKLQASRAWNECDRQNSQKLAFHTKRLQLLSPFKKIFSVCKK